MRKSEFIFNNFTQNITSNPEMPLLCFLHTEVQLAGAMGHLTGSSRVSTGCHSHFANACKRSHQLPINRTRLM